MLYVESVGPTPPRFVFLHGLLGRGRNWSTIARSLAKSGHGSLLVDLPDHGRSDWTDGFSYAAYADVVRQELNERLGTRQVILVGHSLGGKVAMLLALDHPEMLHGLAVVDIAPGLSRQVMDFGPLAAAMQGLDLGSLRTRDDADRALRAAIPDDAVRLFVLQNLHSTPSWHWQPNIAMLARHLDDVAGWPDVVGSFLGRVLWLVGGNSGYADDIAAMRELFPHARRVVISGAGHWVHAERPQAVIDALNGCAVSIG